MRTALLLVFILCTICTTSVIASDNDVRGLSCDEVLEVVKQSDCAELAKPFLVGSHVVAGVSFNSLSVTIFNNNNDELATISDRTLPSPFISLNLKPSFFGHSNWGWGIGFNYSNTYALEQKIKRSNKSKNVDLGTYITTTMLALTPNTFYQFGGQHSERYFRIGVGAALGYAHLRGTAYLTGDKSNTACYESGNNLVKNSGPESTSQKIEAIKTNCHQDSYNQGGLGLGANIFMQGQYQNWQVSLDASNLLLTRNKQKFQPSTLSVQIAYVIPL
jgi:hypothetical protein